MWGGTQTMTVAGDETFETPSKYRAKAELKAQPRRRAQKPSAPPQWRSAGTNPLFPVNPLGCLPYFLPCERWFRKDSSAMAPLWLGSRSHATT